MLFCWNYDVLTLYLETDYRTWPDGCREDPKIPAIAPDPKPGENGQELISRVLPGHVLLWLGDGYVIAFLPGNLHHIKWEQYLDIHKNVMIYGSIITLYTRDHGYYREILTRRENQEFLLDLWNPETGQWDAVDRDEFTRRMRTLGLLVEQADCDPEEGEDPDDDDWIRDSVLGPAPYREIDIPPPGLKPGASGRKNEAS
jgi:hypothetical protein